MKQTFVNLILSYLRFFARRALAKHKPTVIGIGGSAGKSSTRDAIYAVFNTQFPTEIVRGNSETGLPLSLLGLNVESLGFATPLKSIIDWLRLLVMVPFSTNHLHGKKYLIVEMGIDDPLPPKNMEYLLTIIKPDIAVSLNVSVGGGLPAHSMQFEKLLDKSVLEKDKHEFLIQKMAEEETKIITDSGCQVGIYNADDKYITSCLKDVSSLSPSPLLFTFGHKKENTISYQKYEVTLKGTKFDFHYNLGAKQIPFSVNLEGFVLPEAYREVIAATLLVSSQTDLSLDIAITTLEKNFSLPKGRASLLSGINGSVIIDSSYNAQRASVDEFLELAKDLKKSTKRQVVFLFGDMRELGSTSAQEHIEVAKKMKGIVDDLYLVGEQTKNLLDSEMKETKHFKNSKLAGEYMKENLPKDAIVLIKGSQNTIYLEEAVKELLEDKKDITKLCRQESHWLKIKERYFTQTT